MIRRGVDDFDIIITAYSLFKHSTRDYFQN
jgi:hypothetical protein